MNPIGKPGLFVTGFVRWRNGRKCCIRRVKPECCFWLPCNLGCYKTKVSPKPRAQTLKWKPLELLETRALIYIVFLKMKRQCWEHWCLGISDIQILNWIHILPLNGSCSVFCFHSFSGCCRVHNPTVTWWKRLWVFYGWIRRSLPSHTAATSGPLMSNKIMPPLEKGSGNPGWYHPLWEGLLGIVICENRTKSSLYKKKTQNLLLGQEIGEKK